MSDAVRYQVMPPLAPDEYQELYDDIKVNGVLEPIHVDENGVVIDGHHRSKIARELGIPCPVITHDNLDEAGKRSLAFTLNLKRRHLNREQRRALIAESLKSDPQLSNREHARRTGASNSTVGIIRKDMEADGQVCESHTSRGADGKVYPASRPPRQEHAPAPGFNPGDLDEINTPAEEPPKPRRTPITDQFTSAVVDLNRVLDKFHRIKNDKNFPANKNQIATLHGSDLARAISELQDLADYIN